MPAYLLGIDFGTGGAKAALIDDEGNDVAGAYEEYPLIHDHPGWSEHDAENYWNVATRIVRTTVSRARVDPREIKGVAVSSALPSMVMVDRSHNPVHRAYNLLDRRATAEVARLRKEVGEERIWNTSAYPLEDHPNLVNLLWEKHNRQADFKRIWKALTIDGFIALKLTGVAGVHYSGAAFYGVAFDLRERRFDNTLMNEIGIGQEMMPDVCSCDEILGEVTRKAAEETGLAAGTPVAAGQVDCNASWIGAGATDVGDMQGNLGTVGNLGIIFREVDFAFSAAGRALINFPYTTRDTYITVPTTLTGGQTLRYIRDTFAEVERVVEESSGVSSYDLLNYQAEKVPPGSGGLIALPFLMGERSPIWDSNARGTIFGLSLTHTKGHLVRALMEGVAFAMFHNFTLVRDAGLEMNLPLVLNEGGAVSRLWRRIITDVFGVQTAMVKRRSGAPFGDAVLAGVAVGVFPDFSVTKEWVEYVDYLDPQPEVHQLYTEYFELYRKLYVHLEDDYTRLSVLRAKSESLKSAGHP